MKYLCPPSSVGYEVQGKRFLFFMALIYTSHTGRVGAGRKGGGAKWAGGGGSFSPLVHGTHYEA